MAIDEQLNLIEDRRDLLDFVDEDRPRAGRDLLLGLPAEESRVLGIAKERVLLEEIDGPGAFSR